jgi:bacterioferritin
MAKKEASVDGNDKVVAMLNRIMESELAGVVRYTHYSLMVFGYNRIPIISWLRGQAEESLAHAEKAGELITHLGGHPSLTIGSLLETHKHDIGDILREEVEGVSVMLEEYAREMIYTEELHQGEVNKMLRKPGDISVFSDH